MTQTQLYFIYPGDLSTQSGGYHYDRRLVADLQELGLDVQLVSLPQCTLVMEAASRQEVKAKLAAIPDQSVVIVDGLALGVLAEEALAEAERLRLVALCHHPLALETGLNEQQQQALFESESKALGAVRATIVTSPHTKQVLREQFALPSDSITVAVPGTDRQAFASCEGNPPCLLTLASLTRRKGHDVLIEALASLTDIAWRARFVGSDEFDPEWVQKLHDLVADIKASWPVRLPHLDAVAVVPWVYRQLDQGRHDIALCYLAGAKGIAMDRAMAIVKNSRRSGNKAA